MLQHGARRGYSFFLEHIRCGAWHWISYVVVMLRLFINASTWMDEKAFRHVSKSKFVFRMQPHYAMRYLIGRAWPCGVCAMIRCMSNRLISNITRLCQCE